MRRNQANPCQMEPGLGTGFQACVLGRPTTGDRRNQCVRAPFTLAAPTKPPPLLPAPPLPLCQGKGQ